MMSLFRPAASRRGLLERILQTPAVSVAALSGIPSDEC